jgi:Glutamine cyclotransferase
VIVRCLQLLSVVIATTLPHSVALAETPSEQEVVNYDYRVISKTRFDRENFTQGLEIHDGRLYVSSGLYGRSMIRSILSRAGLIHQYR